MNRVIIDTDPGIDDLAAIFLALASPELEVEALTTVFGNVEVEQATRNALALLEVADRMDVPVYRGVGKPLMREPKFAKHIHGENGFGDVPVPSTSAEPATGHAVDELRRRMREAPDEITILALGPLTNVALALSIEPDLSRSIKSLIIMGGAVREAGNATPVASANLYSDPESARIVYESGAPIVQVGLDVCRHSLIRNEDLERIKAADRVPGNFLLETTSFIRNVYRKLGRQVEGGVFYNDVPAVTYAIRPKLFEAVSAYVSIETTGGLTAGETVAEFTGQWGHPDPNASILMNVDGAGVSRLFGERVAGFGPAGRDREASGGLG